MKSTSSLFSAKSFLAIGISVFYAVSADGQLYSSGNTVIAGSAVGIGTSTPLSSTKLHVYGSGSQEQIRMENVSTAGFSRFTMYNNIAANYATFTKYGSAVSGGYPGVSATFPYANMLAFGNNNGPFLNVTSGNIGIGLFKGGTTKLKFFADYNSENLSLGGGATPTTNVHINSAVTGDTLKITNSTTGHTASDGLEIRTVGNAASLVNRENSTLAFGTNNTTRMSIAADGKITIGTATTPGTYKLYVEGGILTEKVKVALKSGANWADYVFADDYALRSLPEVESFVKENRHLPGIPSAAEVEKDGIDVAGMDAKLLEKIEELTLYLIDLQKQVDALKIANEKLNQELLTE